MLFNCGHTPKNLASWPREENCKTSEIQLQIFYFKFIFSLMTFALIVLWQFPQKSILKIEIIGQLFSLNYEPQTMR